MATMLLGGLWHGASWNYVIWGGLHGGALIVHREWQRLTAGLGAAFHRVMAWIAVPLTFYWICITWVYFRASPVINQNTHEVKLTGFQAALTTLRAFVLLKGRGTKHEFSYACAGLFAGLALVHWLCSRRFFATWWRRIPDWAYAGLLGSGVALALFMMPAKYKPFIYFQF